MIAGRFGFLPCDWTIKFGGGHISPIPEINKERTWVEKHANQDGFLYPPRSYTVRLHPRTSKKLGKVPGSDRPALRHPVPPSHELSLVASITQEELRKGPGAFVIHLLAYLFGIRLQFQKGVKSALGSLRLIRKEKGSPIRRLLSRGTPLPLFFRLMTDFCENYFQ